jgi:cytosine/adenosine deaminase-related metal-dependent hydrolase
MIVLSGGTVYGIPNTTATITNHVCTPQKKDVIIAAGRILALMEPSETTSFVDSMKNHHLEILSISIQDQLVIPGLIDPHIHAIGGGDEQGLFRIQIQEFHFCVTGPYSRSAEIRLSQLINGGVTTVVGALGTDGITRRSVKFFHFIKSFCLVPRRCYKK